MNWYKLSSRISHFMPCDRFRMQGPQYEKMWHEMMANAQKISIDEFLNSVDPSGLFDEDIDEKQGLIEEMSDDPESYFAKSTINGKAVYFFYTAGFEFIFYE